MFPINLVLFQMMSEVVRYEIKNFITWTLDFENWHKKIRVGPYSNEHEHWSWLIWLKMEILVHGLILQTTDDAI